MKRLPNELVAQIFHFVHDFGDRVTGANLVIEFLINRDVNIFVDRGAKNRTGFFVVKGGQITATTGKTDAQRCAGYNHKINASMQVCDAGLRCRSAVQVCEQTLFIVYNLSCPHSRYGTGVP